MLLYRELCGGWVCTDVGMPVDAKVRKKITSTNGRKQTWRLSEVTCAAGGPSPPAPSGAGSARLPATARIPRHPCVLNWFHGHLSLGFRSWVESPSSPGGVVRGALRASVAGRACEGQDAAWPPRSPLLPVKRGRRPCLPARLTLSSVRITPEGQKIAAPLTLPGVPDSAGLGVGAGTGWPRAERSRCQWSSALTGTLCSVAGASVHGVSLLRGQQPGWRHPTGTRATGSDKGLSGDRLAEPKRRAGTGASPRVGRNRLTSASR